MELESILKCFFEEISELNSSKIENGHINNTFLIETNDEKFILQKINTNVFQNKHAIAHNHLKVNEVLLKNDYKKQIVTPLKTLSGNYFDEIEGCWRMLKFIDESKTFLKVPNVDIAYESAKALSEFYSILNSDNTIEILDPLPGFINFKKRMDDYQIALEHAPENLKVNATKEISFIQEHLSHPEKWISLSDQKLLPERIIHADPKISNLLFSENNEVLAIIDLDTIMKSTLLYDFGDMIRSYTNKADEDDGKTDDIFDQNIFQSVKKGFSEHLKDILTPTEFDNLDYAAKTVIFIQAVRFLTDYLKGSVYYQIKYPDHNLDRTRNQISLLKGLNNFLLQSNNSASSEL